MTNTMVVAERQEIEKGKSSALAFAKKYEVTGEKDLKTGADILKGIKETRNRIDAIFKPLTTAAHEAHQTIVAERDGHKAKIVEAEGIIKGKIGSFVERQEQEAEDRRREEQEAQARAEAKQQAIDEANSQKAAALLAQGKTKQAEKVMTQAEAAPRVLVPEIAPVAAPVKVKGLSTRKNWKAEVTNLVALCKAIGEGKVQSYMVEANMPALNKMAAMAEKEDIGIAGVVGTYTTGVSTRGK